MRQGRPRAAIERVVPIEDANVQKEVDYILKRAQSADSRVVGFGQFVFFSTHTRDAWMLDWKDEVAICLMKEGEPKPYSLEETDRRFEIQWQGQYKITGPLFTYIDNGNPTHARVIGGYPTAELLQTIDRLRRAI